ncbi:hypothetical protein AB3X52_00315 [Nocardioides sp. DS6]|uniref:LppX_LprAFG lipoprotein n=1 Tax=Nocardioides eburneus TaxID=3231482 RepID=A0ABV3STX6_9ACTN
MLRVSRTLAGCLVVTGLLLATSGCGGDDDSIGHAKDYAKTDGADIAKDARAAMGRLRTMHVAGTITQGGETIALDLSVSQDGSCAGTIGVGDGSIELRSAGGRAWYKADLAFWKAEVGSEAAEVAKAVGDRWVVLSGDLASLRSFCRIDSLTSQMLGAKASYESQGAAMVGTTPTARISIEQSSTGQNSTGQSDLHSTAYVKASDPHYVLRIVRGTGKAAGQVDFSAFDQKFTVEVPATKDIFNPETAGK